MNDQTAYIVAAVMIVGFALPRFYLHMIGFAGCALLTLRSLNLHDGPQTLLNGASFLVHFLMLTWLIGKWDQANSRSTQ